MGYIIAPKGEAVVEHVSSKQRATVQLTEEGSPIKVSKPLFKEDSESFSTTFGGSFQIETDAGETVAGQITVTVQYSSGLDGQEIDDDHVDSSITLSSCAILELPEFEIQEVEDDY